MAPSPRGSALVREVLAGLPADGWRARRKPLAPAVASSLRLDGGRPLPGSLVAWLEFDALSPSRELPLVRKAEGGQRLATRSMQALLEELIVSESEGEEWEQDTRDAMNELAAGFPGEVLLLRKPGGQDLMLYLGKHDREGECPVLAMEHEQLWVVSPGFDLYVAQEVGGRDVHALPDYARWLEEATALCAR